MTARSRGSLRARLAGVLALAVALPVGVVAYTVVQLRATGERQGREEAQALAVHGADAAAQLLVHASDVLFALSRSTAAQSARPTCTPSMAGLAGSSPRYLAFGLADPQGRILCATDLIATGETLVDRHLVEAALAGQGPVLGDLTRLPGSGRHAILYALAARRPGAAAPHAVVFTAIAADAFIGAPLLDHTVPGTSIWVLDRRGVIATQHPEPGRWRGRQARDTELGALPLEAGATSLRVADDAGHTQWWGIDRRTPAGAALTVVVRAPRDLRLASLLRLLDLAVAAGVAAALLGTLLIMFGWKRVLLDDVHRLVTAAQRLGRGELDATAGIPEASGELALVSRSLDELGARLAERERELDALLRAEREARDRLQLVYQALPVGISVMDRDGNVVDWSPGMEHLLGWTAEEMLGRHPAYVPPELLAEARHRRQAALDGETVSYESERLRRDGRRLPVSVYVAPVRDEGGAVIGTVGVMASLAEQRALEARERAAQEELRTIVSAAPLAIFAVDRERRCTLWSAGAERLFGTPATEVLGQVLPRRPDPRDAEGLTRMERALQGEAVAQEEIEVSLPDGRLVAVVSSGVPLRDAHGAVAGAVFTLVDITERKQAERARDAALHEAQVAGRRLTATIEELRRLSHHLHDVREAEQARLAREIHDEFGQLLTGLKVDLRMLGKGLEAVPDSDGMRRRVQGMGELVDQMVTVGRRIVSELRPVPLDKVGLGPVLVTLAQETGRRAGIPIEARTEGDCAALAPATATALYRIAQEALTNVLRHSGATRAEIALSRRNGSVRLVVEDDGRGLALPARPGAMGLLGMRERATLLGGSFRLERGATGGTRVVAEVPWHASDHTT